jgi:hypothetical protein
VGGGGGGGGWGPAAPGSPGEPASLASSVPPGGRALGGGRTPLSCSRTVLVLAAAGLGPAGGGGGAWLSKPPPPPPPSPQRRLHTTRFFSLRQRGCSRLAGRCGLACLAGRCEAARVDVPGDAVRGGGFPARLPEAGRCGARPWRYALQYYDCRLLHAAAAAAAAAAVCC